MTEQEIIQYLKNNKEEGRIYRFMPEAVRNWCNSNVKYLLYFDYDNNCFEAYYEDGVICENEVVALADDYTTPVPIINLKLNLDELNIIKNALEEGLDLDIFEDNETVFPVTDKIATAINTINKQWGI